MSRWFRVYDDLVDDPKVQRLSADLFKGIINLWCLTSQNGGILPPADDIAFKLRLDAKKVAKLLNDLRERGLLDEDETGIHPHNWNGRQFKSDGSSTERVKRFRNGKRNVSCNGDETFHATPPETPSDTEQITDTEHTHTPQAPPGGEASAFEKFWKEFPQRDGANPREPAAQKFAEALKAGSSGEEIVAGARAYRTACDAGNLTGSRFVVQACRWLEERRWTDCGSRPPPAADSEPTAEQLELRRKLIEEGERLLNGSAGKAYLV